MDQKIIDIVISAESIEKLESISIESGLSISDTLDTIIENYFDRKKSLSKQQDKQKLLNSIDIDTDMDFMV